MNKKVIALALALLMAVLAGCGTQGDNTQHIASYTGGEVLAGVYIYNQLNTINQYAYYFGTEGLLEQKIGEQTVKEIVDQAADQNIKRFAAVESEFARLQLTLDQEAEEQLMAEVERAWQTERELLEAKGIGLESVRAIALSNLKTLEVFKAYYRTGGEFAVDEQDVKAYFEENYRRILPIQIPKYDENQQLLTGEALDQKVAEINGYYERAQQGEPMFTLLKEYAKSIGQEIPEGTPEQQYEALIPKTGSGYPQLFVDTVFGPELKKGEPKRYDNSDLEILYELRALDASGLFLLQNMESILYQMKGAEFAEKLTAVADSIGFQFNDAAKKLYTPEQALTR